MMNDEDLLAAGLVLIIVVLLYIYQPDLRTGIWLQ